MGSVLCVGEILIDFICTNKDSSLKDGTDFIKKSGGAPLNVAVAIKKLGSEAYFGGCVGKDPFGDFLIDTLKKYSLSTQSVKRSDTLGTTLAFVSLDSEGERDFTFFRGADKDFLFEDIEKEIMNECNVFHFGSATAFLEGNLEETYFKLFEFGKKQNKIISFDPNYRNDLFKNKKDSFIKKSLEFIKNCDIVKLSEEEAKIISCEDDINLAGKKIISIGAKFVIITIGSKGALLFSSEEFLHIETEPVKMIDATGAGDAFIGTVIALVSELKKDEITFKSMAEFVSIGNKVGAITVQKYGALDSIPTKAELNALGILN